MGKHEASMERVGVGGHIARGALGGGYDVFIRGDSVAVWTDGNPVCVHAVPNYGTAIGDLMNRPTARIAWAAFPDGAEVIYFYDPALGNFGYALNVTYRECSEWGYAPF